MCVVAGIPRLSVHSTPHPSASGSVAAVWANRCSHKRTAEAANVVITSGGAAANASNCCAQFSADSGGMAFGHESDDQVGRVEPCCSGLPSRPLYNLGAIGDEVGVDER